MDKLGGIAIGIGGLSVTKGAFAVAVGAALTGLGIPGFDPSSINSLYLTNTKVA
jgi:hypothetical protein